MGRFEHTNSPRIPMNIFCCMKTIRQAKFNDGLAELVEYLECNSARTEIIYNVLRILWNVTSRNRRYITRMAICLRARLCFSYPSFCFGKLSFWDSNYTLVDSYHMALSIVLPASHVLLIVTLISSSVYSVCFYLMSWNE